MVICSMFGVIVLAVMMFQEVAAQPATQIEALTAGEELPVESTWRARRNLARLDRLMLASGHWAWLLGDDQIDVRDAAEALGIHPARLRLIRAIQTVDPSFTDQLGAEDDQALQDAWRETQPFKTKLNAIRVEREALLEAMQDAPDEALRDLVDSFLIVEEELATFRDASQAARRLTEPLRQRLWQGRNHMTP